jgi:hypothetical protein
VEEEDRERGIVDLEGGLNKKHVRRGINKQANTLQSICQPCDITSYPRAILLTFGTLCVVS